MATFHVLKKGIYETTDLIERADEALPPDALLRLGEKIREEIKQSGRCLAFGNATASGFHILRATELTMHEYYLAVCKPKPKPKTRLKNWGEYLDAFGKCVDPDAKKVHAILQQIKDQDRNLIMHPEIVLTEDEAYGLFELTKAVIVAMAGKLSPLKKKKGKKTNISSPPGT